jgi:hypothetical protein
LHIFKKKDTNFFQSGSLLACVKLKVLSSLICRKATLNVISFEKLRKNKLCSLLCFRLSDTSAKLHEEFVAWEFKVGLFRTGHIAVPSGTAIGKYIDVLNMIRNQPKVIFPPELDGLVCTKEPIG